MARWAVFDVDGTLLPSTSMERIFVPYGFKSGLLPQKNLVFFSLRMIKYLLTGNIVNAVKNNKFYLRNLSVDLIDQEADKFFKEILFPSFSGDGIEKMRSFRKEGYKILVMSGAPSFLTQLLSSICEIDHLISSELEIVEGLYTGEISGLHPYGERKRELLLQAKDELEIDFDKSIAFADHDEDVHHMVLFGRAVAVNPMNKLKKVAIERGWGIEYWR